MSEIDIINETIQKLEVIKENIRKEAIEWWWLNQGEAPIIAVREATVKSKSLVAMIKKKTSIKNAIKVILENLKNAQELKRDDREKLVRTIEEDLIELTETIRGIKEAHEIIEEITEILPKVEGNEKLKKIGTGTINWIKEIFYTNPKEWEERKQMFKNVAKKLKREIQE